MRGCGRLDDHEIPIDYEPREKQLKYTLIERNCTCQTCGSQKVVSTHKYLPDVIPHNSNIILEIKGQFPKSDRDKMIALKEQYEDLQFVICFEVPNRKISPKSKFTYATWCEKFGLEWCSEHSVTTFLKKKIITTTINQ